MRPTTPENVAAINRVHQPPPPENPLLPNITLRDIFALMGPAGMTPVERYKRADELLIARNRK